MNAVANECVCVLCCLAQALPVVPSTLPCLRLLCLNENKIEALDGPSMAQMPAMEVLKVADNKLLEVPPELGKLTNLQARLCAGEIHQAIAITGLPCDAVEALSTWVVH